MRTRPGGDGGRFWLQRGTRTIVCSLSNGDVAMTHVGGTALQKLCYWTIRIVIQAALPSKQ